MQKIVVWVKLAVDKLEIFVSRGMRRSKSAGRFSLENRKHKNHIGNSYNRVITVAQACKRHLNRRMYKNDVKMISLSA